MEGLPQPQTYPVTRPDPDSVWVEGRKFWSQSQVCSGPPACAAGGGAIQYPAKRNRNPEMASWNRRTLLLLPG